MRANWQNRTLFHGDNLKFLRAMNSESVDLIATDPPFKKGKDFHATPDKLEIGVKFQDRWSWERDVQSGWLDQIKDDYPEVWEVIDAANAVYMHKTKKNLKLPRDEVGSDMGAFLSFMAVRLLAMYRVLKPTGSSICIAIGLLLTISRPSWMQFSGRKTFRMKLSGVTRMWEGVGTLIIISESMTLFSGMPKVSRK